MGIHLLQVEGSKELMTQAQYTKDNLNGKVSFDNGNLVVSVPLKAVEDNSIDVPADDYSFVVKKYLDEQIASVNTDINAIPAITASAAQTTGTTIGTVTIGQDTVTYKVDLSALAPLASPALTGAPTAPTQAASTDDTTIATTAFVNTAVKNFADDVVAGLSAALDSDLLNTAAAASFAAVISDQLDEKQDKHAALSSITGLTTSANQMIYTTAKDTYATTPLSSFARTVLDDNDAATFRTTVDVFSKAEVRTEISNLVNSAPQTLDTLKELADALGNDPDFATTMSTELGNKQPLNAALTSISGLSTAANKMIYTTAKDTYAVTSVTDHGRSLINTANAAATRSLISAPSTTGEGASGTWNITAASAVTAATTTGNAGTATTLKTPRTISISDNSGTNTATGTSFNGSEDITLKMPATIKGALDGNAATATKLKDEITVSIADAGGTNTGLASTFDGSRNAVFKLPATIAASLTGTATNATADAEGNVIDITYETKANAITGLSASGQTVTYTKGDGTTGTITTQDTNTLMTQNVSAADYTYPVLAVATPNATANLGAKTAIFSKDIKVNPKTGVVFANTFSGELEGTADQAIADADGNDISDTYETKTNAITGLSVNGRVITYTKGDGNTGTITTQDTGDTHWTTKLIVGNATDSVNAATTNGNTNLRLFDNNTARATVKLTGSGATTITSDAAGAITVNSNNNAVTQTNTTANASYAILLKKNNTTSTATDGTLFNTGVYVNPSTKTVKADIFDGRATDAAQADNVTGTVAVANGGTGLTSSPSMLTNLASTATDNILKASPRPGVTGTLPVANGGTGQTSLANVKGIGSALQVVNAVDANTTFSLVDSKMAANDRFRIAVGGASNAGWGEIAIGDDGDEPIYVRQYRGAFETVKNSVTLLDSSGNTTFPNTVTAPTFSGYLSGIAEQANKDSAGNTIVSTYETKANAITSLGISGHTLTYGRGDNTSATLTLPDNDTHHVSRLYVGAENSSVKAATTNGNTFITITDNNTARNSVKLIGSGAASVTSTNANVITVSSTDQKVTQTNSTTDASYAVLLKKNNTTSTATDGTLFNTGVFVNPSTKTVTADIFAGNATSATKAVNDGNDQNIVDTYATKAGAVHSITSSGTTVTYKNAEGTSLGTFTTQDTNNKVTQTNSTANASYAILLKKNNTTTAETADTYFSTNVYVNPSTKTITATTFNGNATSATKATQDGDGKTITSTYAKLTGADFTGTVTAPTATAGTNTTQVATTAFVKTAVDTAVDTAVTNLLGSAPATLDTLNELAAALGNDANFSTTITTALAGKQPLHAALTSISGLTTAANKMIYTTAANTYAVATLTATARSLLDDADVAAMRTTLSVPARDGSNASGTWGINISGTAATATNDSSGKKISEHVVEYIEGTQTAATGTWTGVTKDPALYKGKVIVYKLPVAGSGNATLTLTLSGGTATAAIPIYRVGTTTQTTHYAANSYVPMVYNGESWYVFADYDTDTNNATAQNISTSSNTYPLLLAYTANATANIGNKATYFGSGIKANPATSTVIATTFQGALSGNATSATKATQDGNGLVISDTYETKANAITNITADGTTVTFHKGDGTTGTFTTQDTNTDTHWTSKLILGKTTSTANEATSNGNTALRLFDNATARNTITVKGTGATSVTSDATGTMSISSTDQKVAQNISTANDNYPILISGTANATANVGAAAVQFASGVKINPSTSTITATTFNGNATTATTAGNVTGTVAVANGGTGQTSLANVTGIGSALKVQNTVAAGTVGELVRATMATNDSFRIAVGGTADAGYVEIATADGGNEPIYVRQYSDAFTTVARTAILLDGSGNTTFPGTVTAPNFTGLASKATGDKNGNDITTTYETKANAITGLSVDGTTVTYTKGNGTTGTITTQDTDTHYTTHLYAGAGDGVANAATTNGATHLIVADNTTARNRIKISGAGATTVTSDANGNITISSTDTNTNTDTLVTQNKSTTNATYPILATPTADANANQGAKTSIFASGVKINPSTSSVIATNFTGLASKATADASGNVITNTYATKAQAVTSFEVNGTTVTFTRADGTTGTFVTQDTNTDTNTHYTTHLYAGTSTGTANASTTNGNTYLILADDSTARNRVKLVGSGGTTVTSDASGNITISSTGGTSADTLMTQAVSTTNNTYPLLATATANATNTATTTAVFASGVKLNPSTGTISATAFTGNLTGNVTGNVSGTAGSAAKFTSAQAITLTGDITGTASSQAGWSITTKRKSGVVGTGNSPDANYQWYKMASTTVAGSNQDRSIILYVQNQKPTIWYGVLNCYVRSNSDGTAIRLASLQWQECMGFDVSNFEVVYSGLNAEIWTRIPDTALRVMYTVISENDNATFNDFWTLYNRVNDKGDATAPTGTRVVSTLSITSQMSAANVTGTVDIAHGGTGATTVANARKALYGVAMNTSALAKYVVTMNDSWASSGYTTLQQLRNFMGLGDTLSTLPVANGGTGKTSLADVTVGAATKATQDGSGNTITTTYATKAQAVTGFSVDGTTVTFTRADGTQGTFVTQDTNTDTNTHYTTHLYAGASNGAANAATSNGATHLILTDDTTVRNRVKISGSGATTVTSDANGNITISSTDTNTNTDTLMTQNVSTANNTYPILLVAAANATANQGAKTAIFASGVKVNPSTSTISATAFTGNLTGNVTGNVSGSSGSCTGNAATATKFANTQDITLTGAVTGTASSQAGWSIKTYRQAYVIGQSGATSTNPWYKVGTINHSGTASDRCVTLLIYRHDSETEGGILRIHTRRASDALLYTARCNLTWIVNSGIDPSKFVLVISDTTATAELWCKVDSAYTRYIFTVIAENSNFSSESLLWTFYPASTEGQSASITTTGAQIVSTNASLKNNTVTPYVSCSTAAATAAKTVTLTGFVLETGSRLTVKFTVTNTVANPTLNVNGTGAKAIYYRGAAVPAAALQANSTYDLVYNGTQYEIIGSLVWGS